MKGRDNVLGVSGQGTSVCLKGNEDMVGEVLWTGLEARRKKGCVIMMYDSVVMYDWNR